MKSIIRKELNIFFSSVIGYMAIIVFLLICGLFLWVFENNILDYGYATMDRFFVLAPWVYMFLQPAISMRSFSEEIKSGTIELLYTLPISPSKIIIGKFLANFLIAVFSTLLTLFYVYTISHLSSVKSGIDYGGILGSYLGLLFLCAAFTAVGIFSSSLTPNQVVAFVIGIVANFLLFAGFDMIAKLPVFSNGIDYIISQFGMQFHYNSISRGLLSTRDFIYFISVVGLFLFATGIVLDKRK
jgi:hypothetical protein